MADTLSRGVVVPHPDDPISSTGVAEMRHLGSTVNTALGEVTPFRGTLTAAMISGGWDNAFTMPAGTVTVPNVTYAGQIANLPENVPGVLSSDVNEGSPVRYVKFAPHNRDYSWETQTQNVSGAFMPWRKIMASDGGGDIGPGEMTDLALMHSVRRAAFKRRRGGFIGTGGKAIVALRWDHGLVNFRDKVLPHLIRLGLPGSMAMNSAPNRWALDESAGVTPNDLQTWATQHGVEVWNHSQTHGSAENFESLQREIATGLADLQALTPNVPIEGFVIPGVPSGTYGGFSAGQSVDRWDTIAGRLILGHHAVSSSHMPGTDGPLTGDQPILGRQLSVDSMSGNAVIQAVDQAVEHQAGLVLFLHPSQLDVSGRMTTDHYVLVLEHLAALRAAGEIEVLTMGGLSIADATSDRRHNLLYDPTFARGVEAWGGSSEWYVQDEGDVATAGTTNLVQEVEFTSREWALGSPRDLVISVRSRNGNNLSIAVDVGGLVRQYDLPTGSTEWTNIHVPTIVPLNASSAVVRMRRISGDYFHVRSAHWLAA